MQSLYQMLRGKMNTADIHVIGLIEDELERFEMTEQQESADSNEGYENENTELDEDGAEVAESPCTDDWEE